MLITHCAPSAASTFTKRLLGPALHWRRWLLPLLLAVFAFSPLKALAQIATTTTLTSSVNPVVIGQNTVLTATLAPLAATGTVTFNVGGTPIGSPVTVVSGKATLTTGFWLSGARSLTAAFTPGTTAYGSSTSTALNQTVSQVTGNWGQLALANAAFTVSPAQVVRYGVGTTWVQKIVSGAGTCSTAFFGSDPSVGKAKTCEIRASATSTTALTSSVNPVVIGQNTILRAMVTPSTATGTVTFKDGTATLGNATLSAGVATFTSSFTLAGTRSLSAVYVGSPTNATSTSATVTQTVSAVSGNWGQIALSNAAFTVPTTQVVRFGVDTRWVQKLVTGSGTCSVAFFGSDPAVGTGKTCEVIAPATSSTVLASSVNPSSVGQSTQLTATVTPAAATGSVTFRDGTTVLGSAPLAAGVASLPRSFTTVSARSLSAVYVGSPAHGASTSPTLVQTVLAAAPSASAPTFNYEYDAQGNPTKTIVAPGVAGFGFATQAAYDSLDRAKTITDAKAGLTRLEYTGADDLTKVTDPRNLVTEYPRNGLGGATQVKSPDTGIANLTYDAAGNLKTRTDSRGVLATYTYDALNRLTRVSYTQAAAVNNYDYTYDNSVANYPNAVGRLSYITFPEGNAQQGYDPQGRVTVYTQRLTAVAGVNAALALGVGYTYDAAGNLTMLRYPSGRHLTIDYVNNLPTAVGLKASVNAAAVPLMNTIRVNAAAGLQGWNWVMNAGVQSVTRGFDTAGRIVRYPMGPLVRDVSYDAAGRITGYKHYLASTAAAQPSYDQTFGYDELDRLKTITANGASWSIGYDANGNRTSVTLNGVASTYTTPTTSNRLTSVSNPLRSFTYDNAGNTRQDTNATAPYTTTINLAGRMATLTRGGVTTTYTYDNEGKRVRKSSSSGAAATVVFVYDLAGHLLGEYNQNGVALREYAWLGDTPVAVFTPDPANAANPPLVYYMHTDHLDTPRVVVDRANNVRWRWLAEPFGTTAAETNPSSLGAFTQPLRFPGQYADAESGLSYNYFRNYDGSIGRYTQSDPIGLLGGINTYAYVEGNPISLVDPTGLNPALIFACARGAVGGLLAGDSFAALQSQLAASKIASEEKGAVCEADSKAGDTNPPLVGLRDALANGAPGAGKLAVQAGVGLAIAVAGGSPSGLLSAGCGALGFLAGNYITSGSVSQLISGVRGVQIVVRP